MTSFADALKNIEDIKAMGSASTLSGALAAHERIAQRERQISMVESLEALARTQQESLRAMQSQVQAAEQARKREAERDDDFVKCPTCCGPLDKYDQPKVCMHCTRQVHWWSNQPMSTEDAIPFCENLKVDDAIRTRLLVIQETRFAASLSAYGFGHEGLSLAEIEKKGLAYYRDYMADGSLSYEFVDASKFHLSRTVGLCQGIVIQVNALRKHIDAIEQFRQAVSAAAGRALPELSDFAAALSRAEEYLPVYDKPLREWLEDPRGKCDFATAIELLTEDLAHNGRFDPDESEDMAMHRWTERATRKKGDGLDLFVVESVDNLGPPQTESAKGWFAWFQEPSADITTHALHGRVVRGSFRKGFNYEMRPYKLRRVDGSAFDIHFIQRVEASGGEVQRLSAEVFQPSWIAFQNGQWWKWDGKQWLVWESTDASLPSHATEGTVVVRGGERYQETANFSAGLSQTFAWQEGDCLGWPVTLFRKDRQYGSREVPQAAEIAAALAIARGIHGKDGAAASNPTEAQVTDVLVDALCCIAAADGKLKNQEIDELISGIKGCGCTLAEDQLRATIVDRSKKIFRAGPENVAKEIARVLHPHREGSLCRLVLDLLQTVAKADGRVGAREQRIISIFDSLQRPDEDCAEVRVLAD